MITICSLLDPTLTDFLLGDPPIEWDFRLHNVPSIMLTDKKIILQDSNCLSNERYLQKGADFERIKKHVHNQYQVQWSIVAHFLTILPILGGMVDS